MFIWRLGQAKDIGLLDADWNDIAKIINTEFRNDESEYRTESAYRKQYQYVKRFYDSGVFDDVYDNSYIEEVRKAKHELRKEKQKLFDERTALNKTLRENARVEQDLENLEHLIRKTGVASFPQIKNKVYDSDNDLIIALSDFHFGIEAENYFGAYNSCIAGKRLSKYLSEIIEIQKTHHSENAYVLLLGDVINGEIRITTQLENRENIVEQVQKSSELISAFVYELSKYFNAVYVNNVAGNHSRTHFKDEVLRGNRLDNLVPWYVKAKLSHVENVTFIDAYNYDQTIGVCNIRGNKYIMVHGDFDDYSEKGVSKLVMMLGIIPKAIFYGHMHRCSYDDVSGVKIVRSGSFSGTIDDYTISKRLKGYPQQMVCVVNDDGIKSCYPVNLSE